MSPASTSCARRALLLISVLAGPSSGFATGHITLTWDPVAAPEVSYHVYYGTQRGAYTEVISVGNETSTEVCGLDEGSTYYFAIASCDSSGTEGNYSPEVSHDIPWSTPAGSNWLSQVRGNFNGLFREAQQS